VTHAPAPRRLLGAASTPVFERVLVAENETFLWRCDDYPWERNVWNTHPEIEIHLVRSASGVALVGDHVGAFEPGHLAVVGGGLPHDWVTPMPRGEVIQGRDIVVQFHPDRLRSAAAALPELAEVEGMLAEAARGLAFSGETRRRGAELLEGMGTVEGLERLALFIQLLVVLSASRERRVLSSEGFVPATDRRSLDTMGAALAFVVQNASADIRLSDLAAHLGMSEWACSRFFKKNAGNDFTDYVAQLRIGHACKLLSETDLTIMEICFEVGYRNLSNFNRTFRLQRGLTPSSYRRLARNRRGALAR
jgi:AraC-like DNA-binding protein